MFQIERRNAKTLSWWNTNRTKLETEPYYQRAGRLWSPMQKAFLIDSILNGFDIPKIYVADFTFLPTSKLNLSNKPYAVIDGKQRFEAIFEFFADELPLSEDFLLNDRPSLNLRGMKYSDIRKGNPEVAAVFENFNLDVMHVITDEDGKIDDLFVRLNQSKPLSSAEVRNALKGQIPSMARGLCRHVFFTRKVSFSTRRKEDLNVAFRILLTEFRGGPTDLRGAGIEQFLRDFARESESLQRDNISKAYEDAVRNLDRLCDIFDDNDPLLRTQGSVPIYYLFSREADESAEKLRAFLQFVDRFRSRKALEALDPNDAIYRALSSYHSYRTTNDQYTIGEKLRILRTISLMWSTY